MHDLYRNSGKHLVVESRKRVAFEVLDFLKFFNFTYEPFSEKCVFINVHFQTQTELSISRQKIEFADLLLEQKSTKYFADILSICPQLTKFDTGQIMTTLKNANSYKLVYGASQVDDPTYLIKQILEANDDESRKL
jgi:hypothetical protein